MLSQVCACHPRLLFKSTNWGTSSNSEIACILTSEGSDGHQSREYGALPAKLCASVHKRAHVFKRTQSHATNNPQQLPTVPVLSPRIYIILYHTFKLHDIVLYYSIYCHPPRLPADSARILLGKSSQLSVATRRFIALRESSEIHPRLSIDPSQIHCESMGDPYRCMYVRMYELMDARMHVFMDAWLYAWMRVHSIMLYTRLFWPWE